MFFPGGSDGKASAYNAEDLGSILGSGRSPGEGNGNPVQYSCLENPMDEAWLATVHGVAMNRTQLSDFTIHYVLRRGFPDSSVGKESACNTGNPGSIPGLGRSAGQGIGYPFQYSWASLVAHLVKNLPAKNQLALLPGLGTGEGNS